MTADAVAVLLDDDEADERRKRQAELPPPDLEPIEFFALWSMFRLGVRPQGLFISLAIGIAVDAGYTDCDWPRWTDQAWAVAEDRAAECAETIRRFTLGLMRERAADARILAAARAAERRFGILGDLAVKSEKTLLREPAIVSITRRLYRECIGRRGWGHGRA